MNYSGRKTSATRLPGSALAPIMTLIGMEMSVRLSTFTANQRTIIFQKCGKKCFLGPNKSFPICKKNTCKVSSKGVYAAYIRGRQYSSKGIKYRTIAKKANNMLMSMGKK
jgi:hypothetical protein